MLSLGSKDDFPNRIFLSEVELDNGTPTVQLQMVWPENLRHSPPEVSFPKGYTLQTFPAGDEQQFYRLMDLAGWPGWGEEELRPWKAALLDENWFVAVESATGKIVASAMGLHDPNDPHPQGSELGWVAGDPDHAGKGLGRAVCAAVTRRLLEHDHRDIYLLTDDWRLPALKIYLKMGYVPLLFLPEMAARWRVICEKLGRPFTPEKWPTARNN